MRRRERRLWKERGLPQELEESRLELEKWESENRQLDCDRFDEMYKKEGCTFEPDPIFSKEEMDEFNRHFDRLFEEAAERDLDRHFDEEARQSAHDAFIRHFENDFPPERKD